MDNYKLQAAEHAFQLIKPSQIVGLGDGSTILHLVDLIAADTALMNSITFASSSIKTIDRLKSYGVTAKSNSELTIIDIYFDGCDQFDQELNALKSGSGIHTLEKILAFMANEFILIGDAQKYAPHLTTQYPLVVEVLPDALGSVLQKLRLAFDDAAYNLRQEQNGKGPVISGHGNYLLEVRFNKLPELSFLNTLLKMWPGVVNHSLFYRMANKAIISGPAGIEVLIPPYNRHLQ